MMAGARKFAQPMKFLSIISKQTVDVAALEAADIAVVVDVARRRSDEDEPSEPIGLAVGREHADHAAHRVSDEDDVVQVERMDDVEDVLRVALERSIAVVIVLRLVGLSGADIVEEDDAIVVLEGGDDVPPHVLIAAEAMSEQHGPGTLAGDADVVAFDDVAHAGLGSSLCKVVSAFAGTEAIVA